VGCLVLTGVGRAFCAGADIFEEKSTSAQESYNHMCWGQSVLNELAKGKPSIAALNGLTLGGGLELALACDIRIAADIAELALPEAAMGTVPAWGGLPRLLAAVGTSTAKMIVFTGRRYNAAQAQKMGLVSEVVAHDKLLAHTLALGCEIASKPKQAIEQIKSLLHQAQSQGHESTTQLNENQARAAERLWDTPARAQAMNGFITRSRLRL
jgi:enoyl-CoA hydratase